MNSLTRSICCAALLIIMVCVCQLAQATNPIQGGAMLEIKGTVSQGGVNQSVDLFVTDAAIHSGVTRTGCDGLQSDSYVLQGGSKTGCDNGDAFETTQGTGRYVFKQVATTGQPGYEFDISTTYTFGGCNHDESICANPDTGFLTVSVPEGVTSTFTGRITLAGSAQILGGPWCPASNEGPFDSASFGPDTEYLPLGAGGSVTLALSPESSNCGGFTSPSITIVSADQAVAPSSSPQTVSFLNDQEINLTTTFAGNTAGFCGPGQTTGCVATIAEELHLEDPSACDAALLQGTNGNDFTGCSPVPHGTTATILRDGHCAIIRDVCKDGTGQRLANCQLIQSPSGQKIQEVSHFFTDSQITNPVYLIAHDADTPLLATAANCTNKYDPGDVCPPTGCTSGGGSHSKNGDKTVGELNLMDPALNPGQVNPQVLSITAPGSASRGQLINVNVTVRPQLPILVTNFGALSTAKLTLRFVGPQQPACGTIKIVTLPPLTVPLPSSVQSFNFPLTVPSNACSGPYEVSAVTISGDIVYVAFADLKIQ